MASRATASLTASAREVLGSGRFLPVLLLLGLLASVSALMPAGAARWVSLAISVLLDGYYLSVSRAVLDGAEPLPSPIGDLKSIVRRGLSGELVVLLPLLIVTVLLVVFSVGMLVGLTSAVAVVYFLVRHVPHPHLHLLPHLVAHLPPVPSGRLVVFPILGLVAAAEYAFVVIVSARYVAFDRLEEGLRYGLSWRAFTDNVLSAARVMAWGFLGAAVLYVGRIALLLPLGLYPPHASAGPLLMVAQGKWGPGAILAALDTAEAFLIVCWSLIISRMLGHYASIAFVGQRVPESA